MNKQKIHIDIQLEDEKKDLQSTLPMHCCYSAYASSLISLDSWLSFNVASNYFNNLNYFSYFGFYFSYYFNYYFSYYFSNPFKMRWRH